MGKLKQYYTDTKQEETNMENLDDKDNFDFVGQIMAFEQGDLNEDETLELFQYLVNTDMAWTLQGSYGRMAKALLDAGLINPKEREDKSNVSNPA